MQLCIFFSKKTLFKTSLKFKESQGHFFSALQEQFTNIRFIKLHSFQKDFRKRLTISFGDLFSSSLKNQRISYLFSGADGIVSMIAQVLLFLIGSLQIINGRFTIGMFTIFSSYFNMMLGSARYFFNLGKTYQDTLVSHNRLMNIINTQKEKQGDTVLDHISSIKTENLTFFYQDNPVLNNVTINFDKGNIYGIIGPNGSGKSTIANLLIGLYIDEKGGDILYNDLNINKIDIYNLRESKIGMSEQEPTLINDSIKYNLLVDQKQLDTMNLNKFMEILNFNDYINNQPLGIDTIINEKNNNLSGGEKQKISLLRVLLKNPDVMIFDEPTSALDLKSSNKFISYLKSIKKDKIILIITHDTNVIDSCDIICNSEFS